MLRVSFDLDDTLFINPEKVPAEPALNPLLMMFYPDRLRAGTVSLMHWLKEQQIQIWIYTTSFRSERYLRNLFRHYHISIDEIVNGARHAHEVQAHKAEAMPSKYPSHYRIALHVDDDSSVMQNGKRYGFRVYLIQEQDRHWTEHLIHEITALMNFVT